MIILRAAAFSERLLSGRAVVQFPTPHVPAAHFLVTAGVEEGLDMVMSSPPRPQADLRGPACHRYLGGAPSLGAPPLPPRHIMAAWWVARVRPA